MLRDERAINERFAQLQANVKREILVFTKPPYATPPQENVEGLEVSREHTARAMYEFSAFEDPDFIRGVQQFIEAGEDARFVPVLLGVVPGVCETSAQTVISSVSQPWRWSRAGTRSKPRAVNGVPS